MPFLKNRALIFGRLSCLVKREKKEKGINEFAVVVLEEKREKRKKREKKKKKKTFTS